jgi:hypothetical protein
MRARCPWSRSDAAAFAALRYLTRHACAHHVAMANIARDDFAAVENCAPPCADHFFGIVCAHDCRLSRIFVIDASRVMPN